MKWAGEGPCTSVPDPDIWFAERGGAHNRNPDWVEARTICRCSCPVRQQCLAEGLYERYGIWGGLDPLERKTVINRGLVDLFLGKGAA
jgi:hypothetical protein